MSRKFDANQMGARIKALRKAKGMRQNDMADVFHVSEDSIRGYENGKTSVNSELLVRMSNFFQVSMDYLYFGTEALTCEDIETSRILNLLGNCNQKERKRAYEILKLVFESGTEKA